MSGWHHPAHFTPSARAYIRRARAAEVAVFIELVLPHVEAAARICGYAIARHGSHERDLDLVAVPWVADAVKPADLVIAVAAAIRQRTGWGIPISDGEPKPHGRIAITIGASGSFHVDLSVMPLVESQA